MRARVPIRGSRSSSSDVSAGGMGLSGVTRRFRLSSLGRTGCCETLPTPASSLCCLSMRGCGFKMVKSSANLIRVWPAAGPGHELWQLWHKMI